MHMCGWLVAVQHRAHYKSWPVRVTEAAMSDHRVGLNSWPLREAWRRQQTGECEKRRSDVRVDRDGAVEVAADIEV